jgi:Thoeris protein ThsB, TIR-like domain
LFEELAVSENNPFNVFVCHVFQENEDYQRVFEYLESRDNFFYTNHSNPENRPSSGGPEAIKEELRNQIKDAEVVILPLAVSELNPDLINFQLGYAQVEKKPILGIQSFGGTVAINKALLDRCSDVIEWNERTIINSIKSLARNEDTAQWEVLEFTLD